MNMEVFMDTQIIEVIRGFVNKIDKLSDEPLDGDQTQEITDKVHEALDEYFGNTDPNLSSKKYASTSWCVEDVFSEAEDKGIEIDEKDAENLLEENSSKIIDVMIQNGWFVIGELLNEYRTEKGKE